MNYFRDTYTQIVHVTPPGIDWAFCMRQHRHMNWMCAVPDVATCLECLALVDQPVIDRIVADETFHGVRATWLVFAYMDISRCIFIDCDIAIVTRPGVIVNITGNRFINSNMPITRVEAGGA